MANGSFLGIPTWSGLFGYLESCNLTYDGFYANLTLQFGNNAYTSDTWFDRRHNGVFGKLNASSLNLSNWVINESITTYVNSVGFIGNANDNMTGQNNQQIKVNNISINGSIISTAMFDAGFIARLENQSIVI